VQDKIIEKLAPELMESFERERQVVYILAEVRKHIEQSPKPIRKELAALNFFCCWAVHSKGKGGGAERILRRFDEMQPYYPNLNAAPEEAKLRLGETMGLNSLRTDGVRVFQEIVEEFPAGVAPPGAGVSSPRAFLPRI
jgi:hypothetical protein